MFEMLPPMGFVRRLSVWWSCFWRQMAATLPIWLIDIAASVFWMTRMHSAAGHPPLGLTIAFGLLVIVSTLLYLPISGYMTRKGFAAHALSVPAAQTLKQATMLALTSTGWGLLVSVLISIAVQWPLRYAGHPVLGQALGLALNVIGALYVVLPRQARRLRLQAQAAA
ncbi:MULTISPECIES: hypothetical protein [Burkholderia]|uniref:hypothetical protein n=1 Tax=Burkholderia TaxID=32008 RepID=UPI0008422321|nr:MULTISPECIES: hypothetical protein [unclassified Burkholderia]AOK30745.1 hypothetical protein AQ611_00415 [Burkholderia sp. Bp7605]